LKKPTGRLPHLLMAVLAILVSLAGCGPTTGVEGILAFSAMDIPQSEGKNWVAHIVCSRGKHQITQSFPVSDTALAAEFTIPVGTWDVALELADGSGKVAYRDLVTGVVIYPETPAVINFQLKPAHGTIKVIVDLEGHPHADHIMRARVHFNDQYKELIRSSVHDFLEGEYEIAAGSYDFNVELFTESFRIGDKIDLGLWTTIDIEPLSEQTVIWHPKLEQMTITAQICLLPEAPKNLTGKYQQGQSVLAWEPAPAADLEGYNIYWKPSPFHPYSLIATVDRYTTTYSHNLSELAELPSQAYYTVAPFSLVLEGYRSSPVLIPFL